MKIFRRLAPKLKYIQNWFKPKATEKAPTWLHKNPIKPVSIYFPQLSRSLSGECSLSGDLNTQTIYGSDLRLQNIMPPRSDTFSHTWNLDNQTMSRWNHILPTPFAGLPSQPSLNDLETFEMLHDSKQFTSYLKQLAERAT